MTKKYPGVPCFVMGRQPDVDTSLPGFIIATDDESGIQQVVDMFDGHVNVEKPGRNAPSQIKVCTSKGREAALDRLRQLVSEQNGVLTRAMIGQARRATTPNRDMAQIPVQSTPHRNRNKTICAP
jgi:hypothetical protein